MNFKYLVLLSLSVSSFFAIGFDTPRVPITVVFNQGSNNPFASSPRTYNDIFSNFPTIDPGRPGKLPVNEGYKASPQPKSYWSADDYAQHFIRTFASDCVARNDVFNPSSIPSIEYCARPQDFYQLSTEKQFEVLSQFHLYPNEQFRQYAFSLPAFPQFLENQLATLKDTPAYREFYRRVDSLPGIKELYHGNRNTFARVMTYWHEQLPPVRNYDQLKNHLATRGAPIQAAIQAGSNLVEVKQQAFTVNPQEGAVVQSFGGNIADYTQCSGTVLQQATHARVIDMLEQYVKLPSDSKLVREYQEKFGLYVESARQYNQANQVSKANRILDFCQIAVDCSKAVCEGIYEGVKEAVFDILNHPVEVGLCLVAGEYVLAYQASKVVLNCLDIGLTYLANPEAGIAKWNAYVEPVTKLASALYNKQIALRDGIKGVTKFAVQWKTQGEIFGGLHRACSSAANKLGKLANKVPGIKSAERMVTPEGMHFNAADNNFNKANKKLGTPSATAAKEVIKVGNMQQFFAETKFGQTIKNYLEKTKIVQQGQSVYRVKKDIPEYGLKKGYQLYLDNMHKDHLEVFDKHGQRCVTVLNLDGTHNKAKAFEARNRTL